MLSADSTSLMLAADRALPARDHPRFKLEGDRYQASCNSALHIGQAGEAFKKRKRNALSALAGANPRALSREILGHNHNYERAVTFHAPIPV